MLFDKKITFLIVVVSMFVHCSMMNLQASFVDFLIQQREEFFDLENEEVLKRNDVDRDSVIFYVHQNQKKLLKACYENDLRAFDALKKQVFFDSCDQQDFIKQWTLLCNPEEGPTPLLWAVLSNNIIMVDDLLDYINRENIFNQSVLYWAVRLGYEDMVGLLIEKGFDSSVVCKHYHDVFNNHDQRARYIKKQIMKLHEQRTNYKKSMTPMEEAMIKQNQVILSYLYSSNLKEKEQNIAQINDEFNEEIDCSISLCPLIALVTLPVIQFGYLYASHA